MSTRRLTSGYGPLRTEKNYKRQDLIATEPLVVIFAPVLIMKFKESPCN
ncbi:8751_t:CDS:2 [Gigaspora margarita]|uniref:8751_t:CDS:1 n=1 Tax=Gigaspora margarita TaxID=4874 RepID=A0ABN7UQ47_GIGMA|nr:8751_t:CDS:2 [Gigaspora margarita]